VNRGVEPGNEAVFETEQPEDAQPRGDEQAGIINRSRPIYSNPASGNRNGRWNGRARNGGRPNGRENRIHAPGEERRVNGGMAEEVPALPDNPREAALRILHAVDTRSAFSDRMLDGAHAKGGDPRDRALLHELVKGTLRWRGRLDWILDRYVHIGIDRVQPWVKNVLRLGAYQILNLERIPPHAAVDESVKLANKYSHPGTAGLVNSVLRKLAENREAVEIPQGDDLESLAAWGSHPEWIVERWLARFGLEDTRKLLEANNRPSPVGLRVNRLLGTRDELIEALTREGVQAKPARFAQDLVWIEQNQAPGALAVFRNGRCTAQDESEALVAHLVAPVAHERVLDLCAAPGGKCTHLAELMGDEGEVWALERAEARIHSLEQTVTRLGVHSVHVVEGDGRTYGFPMPFDRVLVDAPCSGLGVLGRRADARWRKSPTLMREMPALQLELLNAGGRRLRPGGVLVYSVCSFEPEETTHVVERFLRNSPSFILESAQGILPDETLDEYGFMCLMPHIHGCDGAFAARFRRT
jgi:16S rRNA (cytosine967-C5)-methyltransferase